MILSLLGAQILNFFFPLNNFLLFSNILFLIIYFFYKKNLLKQIKIDKIVFLIAFLISISNIYGSNFSDDINHYHYSYISNTDNTNYIWGLSQFHPLYGTSPVWLIGHSYFNFDNSRLQDIHVLNGLIFFLFLGIFLSQLNSTKKLEILFQPILFSLIIFVLIKYTRLKEFGIDRPAYLIFFISIYYYFKYLHANKNVEINNHLLIFSLITLSIFFIKVIFIFVLLIPIFYYYKNYSKIIIFDKKFFLLFIFLLSFFLKNILISGCLIYPITASCINNLSWLDINSINQFSNSAEIFNKSYPSYKGMLTENEYIKDFNWISTWFVRSKIELFEFTITVFLVIILTFFSFKFKKKLNKKSKDLSYFNKVISLVLFLSFLIFIFKNPNIRMNHHILIISMILIITLFLNYGNFIYKKKIFISIIFISLFFNFSKNIKRIHEIDYKNDLTSSLVNKIYDSTEYKIDNFRYYVGWYGEGPLSASELKNKSYKRKLIFDIIY